MPFGSTSCQRDQHTLDIRALLQGLRGERHAASVVVRRSDSSASAYTSHLMTSYSSSTRWNRTSRAFPAASIRQPSASP
jgi:hypothetical protein